MKALQVFHSLAVAPSVYIGRALRDIVVGEPEIAVFGIDWPVVPKL